jgi:hypothetical protein
MIMALLYSVIIIFTAELKELKLLKVHGLLLYLPLLLKERPGDCSTQ